VTFLALLFLMIMLITDVVAPAHHYIKWDEFTVALVATISYLIDAHKKLRRKPQDRNVP